MENGGAEGDRTPDLRIANAALSQLSYGPMIPAGGFPGQAKRIYGLVLGGVKHSGQGRTRLSPPAADPRYAAAASIPRG